MLILILTFSIWLNILFIIFFTYISRNKIIFLMAMDRDRIVFYNGLVSFSLYLLLGSMFAILLVPTEEYIVNETEICALSDSDTITDRSFLFSGYIEDELRIRYVINTEQGKQIKDEAVTDDVYIKETNTKHPKRIQYGLKPSKHSKWLDFITCNWVLNIKDKKTVFEVPKGSVTSEYNIDLE